jgi:hypothetical protein
MSSYDKGEKRERSVRGGSKESREGPRGRTDDLSLQARSAADFCRLGRSQSSHIRLVLLLSRLGIFLRAKASHKRDRVSS